MQAITIHRLGTITGAVQRNRSEKSIRFHQLKVLQHTIEERFVGCFRLEDLLKSGSKTNRSTNLLSQYKSLTKAHSRQKP